ncbi:MAG: SagB/ThcOx family dehydrogenase [Bacteroidales bacterium]|nr:SagB/ThcOx family dehydrogenase [Bacteroidales bacterium]
MKKILILVIAVSMISINAKAQSTTTATATGQDLILEPVDGGGMPLLEVLKERKSIREFNPQEIEPMRISRLLWAANGENRPDEHKRTAPSARNSQEIEVYVFLNSGIYKYMPEDHQVKKIRNGDFRKQVLKQDMNMDAPMILVLVANYDKMKGFEIADRDFYSAIDCGYVSQNIYLCCESEQMSTVAVGQIERDKIAKLINLKNGKVMIAHPVGSR